MNSMSYFTLPHLPHFYPSLHYWRKTKRKGSKRKHRIPLKPSYWILPGESAHTQLQNVRGYVGCFNWVRGVATIKKYAYWTG